MSLDKKNLGVVFTTATLLTLITKPFLFYFSPFLIILYYQKDFSSCLWGAFFCGLIVDLFATTPFGLSAINFTLTTCILYHQRWNFFADSFTTLPLMTYLFSFISTLLQVFLMYVFGVSIHITWQWILIDLLLLPAFDALFSILFLIQRRQAW